MPRYYAILETGGLTNRTIRAMDLIGLREKVQPHEIPVEVGTVAWLGLGPRQPSSALLRDLSEMLWSEVLS